MCSACENGWEGGELPPDGLERIADSDSDEVIEVRVASVVVDKKISVKGNQLECPFCQEKWERTVDSLPGDLITCRCGRVLEIEGVE